MRIGVNCTNLDASYMGGVNTFTLGLLQGFAREGGQHTFQLYVTPKNMHLFSPYENLQNFQLHVIRDALFLKRATRRAALRTNNQALYRGLTDMAYASVIKRIEKFSDLVYVPTTTLPFFRHRIPTFLSMHDIQQFHYPQFFSTRELAQRRILYDLSVRYTDYFQASSSFIKADLLKHFAMLSEQQIDVIPEGVDVEAFGSPDQLADVRSKYGLPDKFLFFPAQLWPHKNHITVLKALHELEVDHGLKIPLVLTGAKYAAADEIFEFIEENEMNGVTYLGKVPFEDIVALYHCARFMITAVLYESSSLPVLEAAACGTPVIASRTPPNEETGNLLKLNLFDPLNHHELAVLLSRIWGDDGLIKAQVSHNLGSIGHYAWPNIARQYLAFFARGLAEGASGGRESGGRQSFSSGRLQ
jgi:glycosyltransferase involved in cell wall biosynthesis